MNSLHAFSALDSMNVNQSIPQPNGITVFGSGRTRVEPDYATFQFTVSEKHKHPRSAFDALTQKIIHIRKGLVQLDVSETDVQVSRLTADKEQMFLGSGTVAVTTFSVKVSRLEKLTDVLVYVIDQKCRLDSEISFGTSRLPEKRAESRQRAVAAAREKAEIYADAANVSLGAPIHIEDVNPDAIGIQRERISRFTGRYEGMDLEPVIEDEGIFDASWVPVDGAVMITFSISASDTDLT